MYILQVVPLGDLPRTWISFMFTSNSSWIPVFNQVSIMWQSYFHFVEEKYTKGPLKCINAGVKGKGKFEAEPLALRSFIGMFIFLFSGLTLALLLLCVELVLSRLIKMHKRRRKRGRTLTLLLKAVDDILRPISANYSTFNGEKPGYESGRADDFFFGKKTLSHFSYDSDDT